MGGETTDNKDESGRGRVPVSPCSWPSASVEGTPIPPTPSSPGAEGAFVDHGGSPSQEAEEAQSTPPRTRMTSDRCVAGFAEESGFLGRGARGEIRQRREEEAAILGISPSVVHRIEAKAQPTSLTDNQWQILRQKEVNTWKDRGAFEVSRPPVGTRALRMGWNYEMKSPVSVETSKARLYADGGREGGQHILKKHAPTALPRALPILLQLSLQQRQRFRDPRVRRAGVDHARSELRAKHLSFSKQEEREIFGSEPWEIQSDDAIRAYLQSAPLEREVWADPPEAVRAMLGMHPDQFWLLRVGVDGLIDSPSHWFSTLANQLLKLGLVPLQSDQCIFVMRDSLGVHGFIRVHVDDLFHAGDYLFKATVLVLLRRHFDFKPTQSSPLIHLGIGIKEWWDKGEACLSLQQSCELAAIRPSADITQVRSLVGKLANMVKTKIGLSGHLPGLQSRAQKGPVDEQLIKDVNKAVVVANEHPPMLMRAIGNGFQHPRMVGYSDSSFDTLPGSGSQGGGALFMMEEGEELEGKASCVYSRSGKNIRISASPTQAETRACETLLETALWIGALWGEMTGQKLSLDLAIDPKGCFDTLKSVVSPTNKTMIRSVIFLRSLLQSGEIRRLYRIPRGGQVADILCRPWAKELPGAFRGWVLLDQPYEVFGEGGFGEWRVIPQGGLRGALWRPVVDRRCKKKFFRQWGEETI
jgi:hypothetical protein